MSAQPLKRIPGEPDSDGEQDDDFSSSFLPANFGQQEQKRDLNAIFERARRVPAKPPKPPASDDDSDDDDDDDDSDDDEEYPISHWVHFKPHQKAITSISLDSSGTRFVTASHDNSIRLFDFPSMSSDHKHAFRATEPSENHHVHAAHFSPHGNGKNILVIPASNQAKIYDRDGYELVEFVKGDQYLRDMHNTKGHVAEITAGAWSPVDENLVATASADSSIRIWDVNNKRQHKEIMVFKSREKGGRSRMCSLVWGKAESHNAGLIASVALDGTLVVYGGNGPFTRPLMEVREAHGRDTWTGGLAFSGDGRLVVSRGMDGCVKLWDTRKLKAPITTRTEFETPPQPESNLVFSPNGSNILCGDAQGNLHILSAATLRSEETHPIFPGNALTSITWHPNINQILCGSSSGDATVLFSTAKSTKGAITILSNAPRKRHIDDDPTMTTDITAIDEDSILNPALAGQAANQKRKLQERMKPKEMKITPFAKNAPDEEYVRKTHVLGGMRDEDPREALLKYAEKAEKDPMFTSVYQKTQPKTIYADITGRPEEEQAEEDMRKKFKKRKI